MLPDNRREFTENERQFLFDEVHGRCPLCGKRLTHKKGSRLFKSFEVAHIYPANPSPVEIQLLAAEERLSADVNDLINVIAVCQICHDRFDTPRTVQEYRSWVRIKKKIVQDNIIKDAYSLFHIEEEIVAVMKRLNTAAIDEEIEPLSLQSLKIDEKAKPTLPYSLKRSIKTNIVDYFQFIKGNFANMDVVTPYKFGTIAAQIKSFHGKCMQVNDNQEYVFYALVDWLDEKTDHYSKQACEILVAFFIQDCEVFS